MKVRTLIGVEESMEQEQAVPELCLPRCKIGMEYEWESTSRYPYKPDEEEDGMGPKGVAKQVPSIEDVRKYFSVHVDNSLRFQGMEFTFKGGYSGSKILRSVRAMDACSRALGFTGSYRTSLHVHIDMQDTNFPEDVEQFGAIYCVVEPFLYQFVGAARNVCNYCIPWYKHPQQFENFLSTIRRTFAADGSMNSRVVQNLRSGKGNKYSGLNCFSLGDFGTVEFRQAPVTMSEAKILMWINLIMRIKEWVVTHPMTLPKVVDYCNAKGADWLIHDVFQSHYPDAVRLSRNLDADYWNGMETLYQYVSV